MTIPIEFDKYFVKSLKYFSVENRLLKLAEEMAELMVAVTHYEKKKDGVTLKNIIEEIADVELMLEQLKRIYEIEKRCDYEILKKIKLKKFAYAIKQEEERRSCKNVYTDNQK